MTPNQPLWRAISAIVGLVLTIVACEFSRWEPRLALIGAFVGIGLTLPLAAPHTGYMVERWLRKR